VRKKKLLDVVRDKIRLKHYSYATERGYVSWIKRYIIYHDNKHPIEMGKPEIEQFLTHLAVEQKVSPTTRNQAFSAVLFLYKEVLVMKTCKHTFRHSYATHILQSGIDLLLLGSYWGRYPRAQ